MAPATQCQDANQSSRVQLCERLAYNSALQLHTERSGAFAFAAVAQLASAGRSAGDETH